MTYDQLRATLSGYMHRSDVNTVDNEPVALELARVKLGRHFFPEFSGNVAALVFVDNGDGTANAPLPADFGQADTLYTKGQGDFEFVTAREFSRRWAEGTLAGVYTVAGLVAKGAASLATAPAPGARLNYYRVIDPIAGGETNWCSDRFPDVWLWQAIAEQHRYVQDGESAAMAEGYSDELAGAAMDQTRANREGGVLRMTSR